MTEISHSVIARPHHRRGRGNLIEDSLMRLLRYARNDRGNGITTSLRLALVMTACLVSSAFASDKDVGTSSAQFLKIGAGNPKALALGRSYVAIADGIESMGFNPAGLARANSRELAFGISEWIDGFRGNYLAYGQPHLRSNLGFSAVYYTMGDFDVRDENGLPISNSSVFVRTGYVSTAFAWSLPTEQFFMGVGIKGIFEDYSLSSSFNPAVDAGVLWKKSPNLSFGASLLNLNPDAKKVPWSLRGGFAWRMHDYLTSSLDLIGDRDSKLRIGAGANINLPSVEEFGTISLRFGYFTSDDQGESSLGFLKKFSLQRTSGVSMGLGVETESETLYNMSFDYAIVPLGALGTTHHAAVKFRF